MLKRMIKINIEGVSNNYLVLKKKNYKVLYIYNKNKFITFIPINNNSINLNNSNIKIFNFSKNKFNNEKHKLTNSINNLIFSWKFYFSKKIEFTGKGFKIKKKQKMLNLLFNYAHPYFHILKSVILKKIKKNKLIVFSKNIYNLNKINKNIINARLVNIYTKRGLRNSKQVILKKNKKK